MKIIINRIRIKKHTTDGKLFIDGQHICDTVEATPTLIPPGTYNISIFKCARSKRQIPIIQMETPLYYKGSPISPKCQRCVEVGCKCEHLRLSEYDKILYAIENQVPHAEIVSLERMLDAEVQNSINKTVYNAHEAYNCPKILFGNGVYNRHDGSILVGMYRKPGVVIQSRPIFDRLYDRIDKAITRGHQVQITIYNS